MHTVIAIELGIFYIVTAIVEFYYEFGWHCIECIILYILYIYIQLYCNFTIVYSAVKPIQCCHNIMHWVQLALISLKTKVNANT